MVDFTSSLYLGLDHPSDSVAPWPRLTVGVPAALTEPDGAIELATALARLVGGDRAILMPSTLHLFLDLFANAGSGVAFFWDEALYPVAAWGLELARARGIPTRMLPHRSDAVDSAWIDRRTPPGHRPVIVADGFCTGCGRAAPLRRYVESVNRRGGMVVIDDTQALGLLGATPSARAPFGVGGGGLLRHHGLEGAPIVVGASLAKAFGVPVAVVVGPEAVIDAFAERSQARSHSSPPAAPLIQAASGALAQTARFGADLRRRLAARINFFRRAISGLGLRPMGALFPVQSIVLDGRPVDRGDLETDEHHDDETIRVHQALLAMGVRAVITRLVCRRQRALTFVLRANHRPEHLAHALRALHMTLRPRLGGARFRHAFDELSPGGIP